MSGPDVSTNEKQEQQLTNLQQPIQDQQKQKINEQREHELETQTLTETTTNTTTSTTPTPTSTIQENQPTEDKNQQQ